MGCYKILRCKQCNAFLCRVDVRNYLVGSKADIDIEIRCCNRRCKNDNVFTLSLKPKLKKKSLPYT